MQKQRQQLHERQAAAFEQLRAVALVKVHDVFLRIVISRYTGIFAQDLPRYPHGGKDSSEDDLRFAPHFCSTAATSHFFLIFPR